MDATVGLVILAAAGFGAIQLLRSRARGQAKQKDRADRDAKRAHANARAIQKSIDQMR